MMFTAITIITTSTTIAMIIVITILTILHAITYYGCCKGENDIIFGGRFFGGLATLYNFEGLGCRAPKKRLIWNSFLKEG